MSSFADSESVKILRERRTARGTSSATPAASTPAWVSG